MSNVDQSDDIIRYVQECSNGLTASSAYFVDIAELAEQIQDTPENRAKLLSQLRKNLPLLEAHAAAWQGLLARLVPDSGGEGQKG